VEVGGRASPAGRGGGGDQWRLVGGREGGFEGASPQRAEEEEGTNGGWRAGEQVTEKPTQPPAPFQCNPKRCDSVWI
jgi:hypothetical protein